VPKFASPYIRTGRQLMPNYSFKRTAANRHGIFIQFVATATYLKR